MHCFLLIDKCINFIKSFIKKIFNINKIKKNFYLKDLYIFIKTLIYLYLKMPRHRIKRSFEEVEEFQQRRKKSG